MKNKKQILITGALCIWSAMANAQQVEPLTHQQRLFDDGKELFLRHDYAAAQQTLIKYISSASDNIRVESPRCHRAIDRLSQEIPGIAIRQPRTLTLGLSIFF